MALAVQMCKQFGWTYEEYMNAPTWFSELFLGMKRIDDHKAKSNVK